jgi:hypothetical protein
MRVLMCAAFYKMMTGMATFAPGSDDSPQGGVVRTILIVEDRFVSDFISSILTKRGHRVICESVDRAQSRLESEPDSIDLLITNTPLEFAAAPQVPLLYVAASPDPERIRTFARARMLAKPFHPRDMLIHLRELLD